MPQLWEKVIMIQLMMRGERGVHISYSPGQVYTPSFPLFSRVSTNPPGMEGDLRWHTRMSNAMMILLHRLQNTRFLSHLHWAGMPHFFSFSPDDATKIFKNIYKPYVVFLCVNLWLRGVK